MPDHQTGADQPPTTTLGPALTTMTWQQGRTRRGPSGDGFPAAHAVVGCKCPLCPDPIGAGEPWQVFAVGPTDLAMRLAHSIGGEYEAAATVAHLLCMLSVSDDALDNVAAALLAGGADRG